MRNRLLAGATLLVVLGVFIGLGVGRILFKGNRTASAYSGVMEQPSDPSFPSAALKPGRRTLAFRNTGRDIQQLALSITSQGTLTVRSVSAYMQMSNATGLVDYSQGSVYIPKRQTEAASLAHFRGALTWNLGDLPSGYLMVVTLRVSRLKLLPSQSYILNSRWYALMSSNQPHRDWKQITGEVLQFSAL